MTRVRADGIGQGSLGRVPRVRVISDTTLRILLGRIRGCRTDAELWEALLARIALGSSPFANRTGILTLDRTVHGATQRRRTVVDRAGA